MPDGQLTGALVPPPCAAWAQIASFGHSYHAYKIAGSLQRVAEVTLQLHDSWSDGEPLPDNLPPLRLALFHTVRAVDGSGIPDAATLTWAKALVEQIRMLVAATDADSER